jgi:(p)ppGpp synthase/HD superfamily hydrolase
MPQNAEAYSSKLYDAIEVAARAHHGQVRKGSEIPYLVHPLAVASILIRAGCPEPLVIAGVLHDTLEDTPLTAGEIRSRFGSAVAELVTALSEPDKRASWEERKTHTVDYLANRATAEVLLVALADKLDNIRAVRDRTEEDGEEVWRRFNRPKELQAWYYCRLAEVFSERVASGAGAGMAADFANEVRRVFGPEALCRPGRPAPP